MLFLYFLSLSKHVITIIKQQAKTLILLTQEGKFTHLVVGIRVRVTLCALLAAGAQRHGAEVVSSEAAHPAQVLGRLPALATITFIFTAA
jgi:hypothetical protein